MQEWIVKLIHLIKSNLNNKFKQFVFDEYYVLNVIDCSVFMFIQNSQISFMDQWSEEHSIVLRCIFHAKNKKSKKPKSFHIHLCVTVYYFKIVTSPINLLWLKWDFLFCKHFCMPLSHRHHSMQQKHWSHCLL